MSTFVNNKDPDEMQHTSGSTLFVILKKSLRQKNTIFFDYYNLTPPDMYNELSQVYNNVSIKPEGRIH